MPEKLASLSTVSIKHPKSVPPTTLDTITPVIAFDYIVRIEIGKDADVKPFDVHNGLITFYSPYFAAALSRRWNTDGNRSIKVEHASADDFSIFYKWLYTRRIVDWDGTEGADVNYETLIRMWIFGDEYGVVIMKNYAINLIVERQAKTWTSYTAAEMTLVYEKTPVGSPLRRLTSNFIPLTVPLGTDIHAHLSGSCANTWPHEYLVFLACALSARSEKFNPLTKVSMMRLHRCAYHEHPRGILCTTTKESEEEEEAAIKASQKDSEEKSEADEESEAEEAHI